MEELDSDIKKRNKLIRLADKSAAGWDLVNEYLSDELASGSEDEKRIRRAEQRALRKRNQRQQKAKPSKQGYSQPQSSTTTTAFADQHSSSSRPFSRTLGANQDQAIFVSPAASKVIGDLSVKLILKPDLRARGSPFLVLLVFRALEVNRTTGLKACSPRLDISFSPFIRHVSFLFGVFQGKGLYYFSRFRLRSQSI